MTKYKFTKKLNINSIDKLAEKINVRKEIIMNAFKGSGSAYILKDIKKKDGSYRTLLIPKNFLKNIQNKIYRDLLINIPLPKCVHGGVKGHSIITNATCHTKKEWVINLDIEKFFDNAHYSRILEVFNGLGCTYKVSEILTGLTTYNHCLPQGAPTSPYLSNLILINLDRSFVFLCKNNGLFYTRYFDDITISGGKRANNEIMKEQYWDIIKREGYKINPRKICISHKNEKQKVNGILVNKQKLRLGDSFIKSLENDISGLIKFGLGFLDEKCFFKEKESLLGKIKFLSIFNKDKSKEIEKRLSLIKWNF